MFDIPLFNPESKLSNLQEDIVKILDLKIIHSSMIMSLSAFS